MLFDISTLVRVFAFDSVADARPAKEILDSIEIRWERETMISRFSKHDSINFLTLR